MTCSCPVRFSVLVEWWIQPITFPTSHQTLDLVQLGWCGDQRTRLDCAVVSVGECVRLRCLWHHDCGCGHDRG